MAASFTAASPMRVGLRAASRWPALPRALLGLPSRAWSGTSAAVQEDGRSCKDSGQDSGLSAKARGKRRAIEADDMDNTSSADWKSPYVSHSPMNALFAEDMRLLEYEASKESQTAHSARAWLTALTRPPGTSSYTTSAQSLLEDGHFYQPPMDDESRRRPVELLARLHCHLLATQIRSSVDGELALKMLLRHCVWGRAKPSSTSAWPSLIRDARVGSSKRMAQHIHEDQFRLIAAFQKDVQLTTDIVTIVLERVVGDVRASHLLDLCVKLVHMLAIRFRSQVGTASKQEARSRWDRFNLIKRRNGQRWRRNDYHRHRRRAAIRKAHLFRNLITRLAELLSSRSSDEHRQGAAQLLNAVNQLCSVHLSANRLERIKIWPQFKSPRAPRDVRWAAQTLATNLPRKQTAYRAVFTPGLCRDVARVLLHATDGGQRELRNTSSGSVTRHLDKTLPADSSIRTKSAHSRQTFPDMQLGRACLLSIFASTRLRQPRHKDQYQLVRLTGADYDAALHSLRVTTGADKRAFWRVPVAGVLLCHAVRAKKAEAIASLWYRCVWGDMSWAQLRTAQREVERSAFTSAAGLIALLHTRTLFFRFDNHSEGAWRPPELANGQEVDYRSLELSIRRYVCARAGQFLVECGSSGSTRDWRKTAMQYIIATADADDVDVMYEGIQVLAGDEGVPVRQLLRLLGDDPIAPEGTTLHRLRHNPRLLGAVIFRLVHRHEWAAIDHIWSLAVERRRRGLMAVTMQDGTEFDRVSRAYLRAKRTQCRRFNGRQGRSVLLQAVAEVWAQVEWNAVERRHRLHLMVYPDGSVPDAAATAAAENQDQPIVISRKMAQDLIYYTGLILGEAEVVLAFWTNLHAHAPTIALAPEVFGNMLLVAALAEGRYPSLGLGQAENEDGSVRPQGRSASSSSLSRAKMSVGMEARALFRRLLFEQHPALSPSSPEAPVAPLDEVAARGGTQAGGGGGGAMRRLGKMLLKASISAQQPFAWSETSSPPVGPARGSQRDAAAASPDGDSVGSSNMAAQPIVEAIQFNASLFEAYMHLIQALSVPSSPLNQWESEQAPSPSPEEEAGLSWIGDGFLSAGEGVEDECAETGEDRHSDGEAGFWTSSRPEAVPLGGQVMAEEVPQGQVGATLGGGYDDSLASPHTHANRGITATSTPIDPASTTPPTPAELLITLSWMRRLGLQPSRSALCLLSIHMMETMPPGLIRPEQPAGPLTAWLVAWLGTKGVPREEEVARWFRTQRALRRDPIASGGSEHGGGDRGDGGRGG